MAGQSVRALALAPSHPEIVIAGSLEGVFRSTNGGVSWQRISPPGHPEIRNVESLAVDPRNPEVIYAGTWHLPWKTTDGGAGWFPIRSGLIDDSDVFVITVASANPQTLYLGACSGIYRSDSAGEQWRKVQGIPFSARRTRAIAQDPQNPAVVYAGTTEGLWKTVNGGDSWRRMTSPALIVNEVVLDPSAPGRLLLATDRAGILESSDGAASFTAANHGFSHRRVRQVLAEEEQIAVVTHHDKEHGGIFTSADGQSWMSWNRSGDHDWHAVLPVRASPLAWLAAADDGLYRYQPERQAWQRTGLLLRPAPRKVRGRTVYTRAPLRIRVTDLAKANSVLFAATNQGVLRSQDGGKSWLALSPPEPVERVTAASGGELVIAGGLAGLLVSTNGGTSWTTRPLPEPAPVNAIALAGSGVYVASGRGLYYSADFGVRWEPHGHGVPLGPVADVLVDAADPQRVWVASPVTHRVYVTRDGGRNYEELPSAQLPGTPRRLARDAAGRLYVGTAFDGVFMLPQ
jgi:photosystem II stability/assembly factor-like uncharacterized protein